LSIYVFTYATAALSSAVLVATQRWHGHYSIDSFVGVQKIHTRDTPRVGGIAIALSLLVCWLLASPSVRSILGPMLLAGVPAFVFGLADDITKKVGVMPRLLATLSSGALAWYLTGIAMQDTGVPPLDMLLQIVPLAVLFTAFAVGGMANAVNIIDGFNGLASGAVAIMSGAIGLMAQQLADPPLAAVCFSISASALGFGMVNWPLGKLFLGDGGAYLLGFCLAWVAVLLPMRHVEVNAWATVLACSYPVLEVGFSVWRRYKREGRHPGQPDKAHLHHLLHRRVTHRLFPNLDATQQNSMTSPLCWFFIAVPAAWAVVFFDNTPLLVIGMMASTIGYAAIYARLTQFRWCFSALTLHTNKTHIQRI
jgi:UDP-N-acetylmuramyl pentapeptide phosphotransferase/UDP-N-acetylglucosamine-1-phosphate transferase